VKAKNDYLNEVIKEMDTNNCAIFWKVVNGVRLEESKGVVQPVKREDGTMAITDEEICVEMQKRYGKKTLEVQTEKPDWYKEVEEEVGNVRSTLKRRIHESTYEDNCGFENGDIQLAEVKGAIKELPNVTSPSPDEKILTVMLKKGGENMAESL